MLKSSQSKTYIQEHLVSIEVFWLSKEPGSVHVEAPGRLVAPHELLRLLVVLSVVNSLEVLHQHVEDVLGGDVLDTGQYNNEREREGGRGNLT